MTCVAGLRDLRGVVSYRPFLRFINKLSLRRGLPLPVHRSHHTISLLIILIINHTVSVQSHIINHTISLLTANPSNPRWTPCWWVFFKHHDSIFQTGFYDSIYSDWFLWFYMFKLVSMILYVQTGFYDSIYSDWFLWFYIFRLVSMILYVQTGFKRVDSETTYFRHFGDKMCWHKINSGMYKWSVYQ